MKNEPRITEGSGNVYADRRLLQTTKLGKPRFQRIGSTGEDNYRQRMARAAIGRDDPIGWQDPPFDCCVIGRIAVGKNNRAHMFLASSRRFRNLRED